MLTKFPRINYRIFRSQNWSGNLDPFRKFNVIYGWNGCGKTTLSGILRKLEKREALLPADGTVEIEVNGTTISAADFASNKALPQRILFSNS